MSRRVDFSKLPKMVSWFNPALLVRALFHHMVAGIFGRYADQRVIQKLGDVGADSDDPQLNAVTRHDYSSRVIGEEPFWVDFVSDLGDGFNSTYSVAYLLAADALRGTETPSRPKLRAVTGLASDEVLPRGEILVMGGDQVYPWPSPEAYESRLQQPYELASPLEPGNKSSDAGLDNSDSRDVFAIPGNHDWYDGLATFDELFCRSRGVTDRHECNMIGDRNARQHRSYFAIKLPHNWWIWGADVQLNQQLDVNQLRFFHSVSEQMQPGDKFILCTAQPSWLQAGTPQEAKTRKRLRQLIDPPIKRGAKLCGIFSGDTHHYSRYNESEELGNFNLFIAGGGGAYVHGTHHLNNEIKLDWIGKVLNFRLDRKLKPKAIANSTTTSSEQTSARAAYPSRRQSTSMAASNVLFAFRNWMFAAAMGVIYWLVTWAVAEINVSRPFDLRETGAVERVVQAYREHTTLGFLCDPTGVSNAPQTLLGTGAPLSRSEQCYQRWKDDLFRKAKSTFAEQAAFERSRQAQREKNAAPIAPKEDANNDQANESVYDLREPVRLRIMAEYALFRANDYPTFGAEWWANLLPLIQRVTYMLLAGLAGSPLTAFMVVILYVTFIQIADSRRQGLLGNALRWGTGTLHFLCHVLAMWLLFGFLVYTNRHLHAQWYFNCQFKEDSWFWGSYTCPESDQLFFGLPTFFWEQIVYPLQMVLAGGLVAGTIFGLYLAASYIFARTNDDWAFSAQSSPDYRNFLRMKFEPNRLVVYPIGIDRAPRLRRRWALPGWIQPKNRQPGAPLVEPRSSIKPRLIEGPIEIKVSDVENVPRGPRSP